MERGEDSIIASIINREAVSQGRYGISAPVVHQATGGGNAAEEGRSEPPKPMEPSVLFREPYAYKAFSPSALPASNPQSPAIAYEMNSMIYGLGGGAMSMATGGQAGAWSLLAPAGAAGGMPAAWGSFPNGPAANPNYPMMASMHFPPYQLMGFTAMPFQDNAAAMAGFHPQAAQAMGQMAFTQSRSPAAPSLPSPSMNSIQQQQQQNSAARGRRDQPRGRGNGAPTERSPQHHDQAASLHQSRPVRTEAMLAFHEANGMQTWQLSQAFGQIGEFCRDQEGSRFIQRHLDEGASAEDMKRIWNEIVADNLSEIVADVFGNYVVQKLIEVGNDDLLSAIAREFQGHVVAMTLQTYGCRVVQRCIECMPDAIREVVFQELEANVARCVQDQNGNHVIQKCIEVAPARSNGMIRSFEGRVKELATHAYGCRVIQCVLQHHPDSEVRILAEMQPHCETLATDQFGNYVMQHVIQHCRSPPAADILSILAGRFYEFALHKFASNVMEKLYKRASPHIREAILSSLMEACSDQAQLREVQRQLGPNDKETPPISFLYAVIKDPYGNYVFQSIIDSCTEDQKQRILSHVRPYVALLRRYTYGKHIVARLERIAQGGTTTLPQGSRGRGRGRGGDRQHQRGGNYQGGNRGGDRDAYLSPSKEEAW